MSDEVLRQLERMAATGDPEAMQKYLHALGRTHGYSPDRVRQLGRMLEVRRLQRVHGLQGRIRAMLQQLWNLRRAGFGGASPASYQDFSRPEFRRLWAQLAQRGSQSRRELAQFIRISRQSPQMAAYVRQLVMAGGASGSFVFLGGQLSGRAALMRAAFSTAARTAGAFLLTPQGLAVATAVLLAGVLLTALWPENDDENALQAEVPSKEQRVAAVNCDCSNINAGLLNVGWIPECRRHEATLKELAASDALNLQVSEQGLIVSGAVCGPINGPAAWPVVGAAKSPPQRGGSEQRCESFVGLTRRCADQG